MQRSWKALSRIVSLGSGGEPDSIVCGEGNGGMEPMLSRTFRTGELRAEDRPCADVHPSMNGGHGSPAVVAGDGKSVGNMGANPWVASGGAWYPVKDEPSLRLDRRLGVSENVTGRSRPDPIVWDALCCRTVFGALGGRGE